jgi:drug/metabolite transporter (DMT)-like permease
MSKSKLDSILLLAVLSIIWGSSFILMKKGLVSYSASQVASMRILFAGLVFVPIIILRFKSIPWNKFGYILLFGILEVGIPPYLYTFAQTRVDSSTAGILNSLVPLFTLAIGMVVFKLRYRWTTTLGVFIGLLGAFIITFMKNGGSGQGLINLGNSFGLLIIFATLLYGIAGNVLKEKLNDVSGTMITAVAFVTLAIPAGIYLFTTNFLSIPITNHSNLYSLGAIIILAVFGSALAILLFSKLIKLSNALFASFVTYLIPFVSLLWGWMDGENISIIHFSSLIVIFLGIYIANKSEKHERVH